MEFLNLTQVNFARLKYRSEKEEHALQGSVRIKSHALGATLTSKLIRSKVGTYLSKQLEKMSCKKVPPLKAKDDGRNVQAFFPELFIPT